MKFSILSLGCPKNAADSRGLHDGLAGRGLMPSDPEEADLIIVNTCGFIEDAKRESIDEILRLSALKNGKGPRLVVMGCLAERYRKELLLEMPEIDAIYGVGEEEKIIGDILDGINKIPLAEGGMPERTDSVVGRSGHGISVPLKIAEGCSRRCSYCVIPSIRGPFVSRSPEDVLKEAAALIRSGAKELLVVAQDLTAYKWRGYGLSALLRDLASISGDFWVRPLYLYPNGIDEMLLKVIAEEDKICKYFDMPLQHSEGRILKAMGRTGSKRRYEGLIKRIREIPGAALRSTFMVGFPGESDADFEALLLFVEETGFDRLGAFKYSKEEGTKAATMKGQAPGHVKRERLNRLMRLQNRISLSKNKAQVGMIFRALLEDEKTGRIYSQAPDIDGVTFIKSRRWALRKGDFVDIKITGAFDYDLEGEVVSK